MSDGIPPYVMGGMQKHSRLLAENVARLGQPVILYHYIPHGTALPTDAELRRLFTSEASSNLTFRTFSYPIEDAFPGHYLRAQKRVSALYLDQLKKEEFEPKLIFTKGFMGGEVLKRRNELPFEAKIAVKLHGMNMFQKQPDARSEIVKYMLRPLVRTIMNAADFVFSYGGKITSIIRAELKDQDKVVELPSGIDPSWLEGSVHNRSRREGRTLKALFVGRWDRLKGLPELINVIRSREDLNLSLTVVGPIPEKHRTEDQRIHFLGAIHDPHELMKVYDDHDALICPSTSEGMPNVIMEAMSRGLAIIATDVGATSELVNSEIGWLIPPKDDKALEGALKSLASDGQLGEKGASAMRRMREEFDWTVIGQKFIDWYNTTVLDVF